MKFKKKMNKNVKNAQKNAVHVPNNRINAPLVRTLKKITDKIDLLNRIPVPVKKDIKK